jgi:hypothetical protein
MPISVISQTRRQIMCSVRRFETGFLLTRGKTRRMRSLTLRGSYRREGIKTAGNDVVVDLRHLPRNFAAHFLATLVALTRYW